MRRPPAESATTACFDKMQHIYLKIYHNNYRELIVNQACKSTGFRRQAYYGMGQNIADP